jgi:hypothetical protein
MDFSPCEDAFFRKALFLIRDHHEDCLVEAREDGDVEQIEHHAARRLWSQISGEYNGYVPEKDLDILFEELRDLRIRCLELCHPSSEGEMKLSDDQIAELIEVAEFCRIVIARGCDPM